MLLETKTLFESAERSGMNLTEYLRENYSAENLDQLQTELRSHLAERREQTRIGISTGDGMRLSARPITDLVAERDEMHTRLGRPPLAIPESASTTLIGSVPPSLPKPPVPMPKIEIPRTSVSPGPSAGLVTDPSTVPGLPG